jgi:lipopolysaccharide export system protein LptA
VCQDLNYDLGIKTGVYTTGGVLKTDSSTVSSREGEYQVNSREARFKKKVRVTDPRYEIESEDLGYNTGSKLVTFYAPSVVTSDSGRQKLRTSDGTYESVTGTAHFVGHSSVIDGEYYLEGDTIFYNKQTGYGFANGHVISIDTTKHSTMFCEHLEYFRFKRVSWATGKPVLKQVNGRDTLFIRADTFYSYPAPRTDSAIGKGRKGRDVQRDCYLVTTEDTVSVREATAGQPWFLGFPNANGPEPVVVKKAASTKKPIGDGTMILTTLTTATDKPSKHLKPTPAKTSTAPAKKTKEPAAATVRTDSAMADTTAPMMFVGYHHVLIFSDSLQGKCDSVSYSQADSTIRMIYKPIAWSHMSQITGDTILLRMDDSGKMKSMYVPNNSFVVSQSGPEQAGLFDQVQGKTLTGYFKDNTITRLVVVPDAQAIYYSKDSKGAYVGESEAKSERMKIYFEKQQIERILFEKDVTQTMTPLEKVDIPEARLGRFSWLMDTRPKSKEELFK